MKRNSSHSYYKYLDLIVQQYLQGNDSEDIEFYQYLKTRPIWNIYKVESYGCTVYLNNIIYIPPDVWRCAPDDLRNAVNFLLGNGFKLGNPPHTVVYWLPYVPVIGWILSFTPLRRRFCTYGKIWHSICYVLWQIISITVFLHWFTKTAVQWILK